MGRESHAEHTAADMADDALVQELQVRHGDHSPEENAVTGELIRRCTPEVDAMLRRTGIGWSDLEDLEQEVFILMVQKIDGLRDPKAFHGWLRQIARNAALNFHVRRGKKGGIAFSQMETEDEEPTAVEDHATPEPLENILTGEREQLLFTALAELPPLDRKRLRQFYLRSMSLNEIVEEEGGAQRVPLGTIKRQLFTARKRLLALMAETTV